MQLIGGCGVLGVDGVVDVTASEPVVHPRLEPPAPEPRPRVLPEPTLFASRPVREPAPPALPSVVGMAVRTADGAASARRALAGLPVVEAPDGPMVPPEFAGGAALVFTG